MKVNRLLLIAVNLIAGVSLAAAATFSVNGLFYRTISDTEVEVIPSPDGIYQSINDVAVPETVMNDGKPYQVTSIADAAFMGAQVYSLSIPSTVRRIGSRAFMNTSLSMARLQAPGEESLVIADSAFMNCRSLYFVGLPDRVISIGNSAFRNCNLESITLPRAVMQVGHDAFAQNYEMESADFEEGREALPKLGNGIFANCVALNSVTLPAGLTMLPSRTFLNTGITAFTISASLDTIGSQCFAGCRQLTDVTHEVGSDHPFVLQDSAFAECSELRNFDMPVRTKSIGACGFLNASQLVTIAIKNQVESIGERAFALCSALLHVSIWPDNPPQTAPNAFSGLSVRSLFYVQEKSFSQYQGQEAWSAFYPSSFNLLICHHEYGYKYNTLCVTSEMNPSFINVAGFKAYKVKEIDAEHGRVVAEQVRYLYGNKQPEGDCVVYHITTPDLTAKFDRYKFTAPFDPDTYLHGVMQSSKRIMQPDDQSKTYYTMSRSSGVWNKVPSTGVYLNKSQAYLCADIPQSQAPDQLTMRLIDVPLVGDLNSDGLLNVTDLNILINMLLGVVPMDEDLADVDGDGRVNTTDVSFMVTLLLGTKIKKGDVNLDGQVNVSDVTQLVNMLLGITTPNKFGDIDENGKLNVSDVTALIALLIG